MDDSATYTRALAALSDDLATLRVGHEYPLSAGWMAGGEPDSDEMIVMAPVTARHILYRTLREVAPGLFMCGYGDATRVLLRVRDANRDPDRALRRIEAVVRRVGAARYTFTTQSFTGFDLHRVIIQRQG